VNYHSQHSKALLQALQMVSRPALCAVIFSLSLVLCLLSNTSLAFNTTTYYHHDALGSPVAATNESGSLKWREDYLRHGCREEYYLILKPIQEILI